MVYLSPFVFLRHKLHVYHFVMVIFKRIRLFSLSYILLVVNNFLHHRNAKLMYVYSLSLVLSMLEATQLNSYVIFIYKCWYVF